MGIPTKFSKGKILLILFELGFREASNNRRQLSSILSHRLIGNFNFNIQKLDDTSEGVISVH